MEKTISVKLTGHSEEYSFTEDAYLALDHYLEQARQRLRHDPDREEVIGDLERSIGDKIAGLPPAATGSLSSGDVEAVLAEVGAVDPGDDVDKVVAPSATPVRGRFLCRIQEDQWFAGVCTGLAAYLGADLGWVRTVFLLLGLFTGGGFILVYLVLVLVLPVLPTRAAYVAARDAPPS